MRIAVMTFYNEDNYGTVLQAAAMREYLLREGHTVDVICYHPDGRMQTIARHSVRSMLLKQIRSELKEENNPCVIRRISGDGIERFRNEHLSLTEECRDLSDLERLNERYDMFLCGSDMIWLASAFDPHMFLDFVHDPDRMVAYAPSILREGMHDLYVRKRIGELIGRFTHLSVREEIGRKLLDEYYQIQTEEVADPILLLSAEEWQEIFGQNWEDLQSIDEAPAHAWVEEVLGRALAGKEAVPGTELSEETVLEETMTEALRAEAELIEAEAEEELQTESELAEETEPELTEEEETNPAEETEKEELKEESESAEETEPEPTEKAETEPEPAEETEPEPAKENEAGTSLFTQGYLFIFFQSGRKQYWDAAYNLAKRLNLLVKAVPYCVNDLNRPGVILEETDPAAFAGLIRSAAYVCTDSYHVVLLAILFHKEMCCFDRYPVGDMSGRNIRILQILDAVGLTNRLYDDNTPLEQYLEKTDYIPVQYKLDALRLKSKAFLTRAFGVAPETAAEKPEITHHVREMFRLCVGCGACEVVCPNKAVHVRMQENGFLEAVVCETDCIRCGKCTQVCPMNNETGGRPLTEGKLLSYSDEDSSLLAASDAGALARRLQGLCLQQGYAVAGCVFDQDTMETRHLVVLPEGGYLAPDEPFEILPEEEVPGTQTDSAGDFSGTEETEITADTEPEEPSETEQETGENIEDSSAAEPDPEEAETEIETEIETEEETFASDWLTAEVAPEEEPESEASGPVSLYPERPDEENDTETDQDTSPLEEKTPENADTDKKPLFPAGPEELLDAMQGIKLSQSNFTAVWKLLEQEDLPVLLIGTPCQIAAARRVFEDRHNIRYIDFVCGGVPTDLLFRKYRNTYRGKSGIRQERFQIHFRYKKADRGNQYIKITDGEREKVIPMKKDALCRMLETGSCCSEACYNCRWRDCSCADLRIGTADASGTGERVSQSVYLPTSGKHVPYLGAGSFGNRKEDITAVFCMTDEGKELLDLLMTQGYWEGLHRQQRELYLEAVRTVNNPFPVFYPELMEMLSDDDVSLRRILNEFAKPIERSEKVRKRVKHYSIAGRKQQKLRRKQQLERIKGEKKDD